MTALISKRRVFDDQDAGFNREAAEAAFEAVAKCSTDEEAAVVARIYLGQMLSHEILMNQEAIGKVLAEDNRRRLVEVGKRLMATAVQKQRDGLDNSVELEGIAELDRIAELEDISKAMPFGAAMGPDFLDPQRRAEEARKQKRDLLSGRFVVDHKDIVHMASESPLHPDDAALVGIPSPQPGLTRRQRAIFQRGYREVQDLLDRYSGLTSKDAVLHLHYDTGPSAHLTFPEGGKVPMRLLKDDGKGNVAREGIDPKRKLVSADLSILPSSDLEGPGVQARFANAFKENGILGAGTWNPEVPGSLGDALTRSTDEEQYATGARALRRVGALSGTLHDTLGDKAPPRLKLALKVGQHAGTVGPEAQRVLGPAGDRAAYRYRGTQRKEIDPRLTNALDSLRRNPNIPVTAKREVLIHGTEDDQGNWRAGGGLSYFRSLLPRADLNTLQRKSGNIPPSQGVIFDKRGRAAVQAVGFGDDHYLPFNLKNLAKLRGGEYIRTRTFGGPTTEDIYTGLMSGARSTTVVSHNGVYTVEFDDDLKGGRRFNDKAARMVARYGQLLDAVQSEQVTTGGIHPSRMAEIRETAGRLYDQDRDEDRFNDEVDRLKKIELRNPTFSAQQKQEATVEWLREQAVQRTTPDGHEMTPEDLVADLAQQRAVREMSRHTAEHGGASGTLRDYTHRELTAMSDPDPVRAGEKIAVAMGKERSLENYLKNAEGDYRATLAPLQLNSQGYELALTALQEQFPYYIKRVDFHPWTEGGGNAFDTGYVMPKHNRPAQVLSGYYNRAINGHGKVEAHTTRFQNYTQHKGQLKFVESAQEKQARRAATTGGTQVKSGETDPKVAAELKKDAARSLIANLRSNTHFSPRAMSSPGAPAIANQPIVDFLDAMKQGGAANALHDLLSSPAERIEDRLREQPERLYATLDQAIRENQGPQYLDLDPKAVRQYANEGRVELPKEIGHKASERLDDHPDTEYDIPGSVYSQDHPHTMIDVHRAYEVDPRVDSLVKLGLLPNSPADGAAFKQQADALRVSLKGQRTDLNRWKQKRAMGLEPGLEPVQEHVLDTQAEGLLRAQQLRRRYADAQAREALIAPASTVAPTQILNHFHFPDEETARNTLQLPGSNQGV